MKKTCSILAAMLLTAGVCAQSPQSMSYQAVIRNSSDALVTDTQVGMQISILQGSESGTAVYAETHTPKTSANGLVSLEIGTGEPVTGTFSGIDWAAGPYFVKTETDPDGGTNYTIAGTSQLLSVPYALHARNVEIEADGDATNELQKITISGSILTLDKNGGSVTLPTGGTEGDNWGTQAVVSDATLTGSGTAATPLKIADNGVTSAKILDGTVSSADIANNAINSSKIQDGSVVAADLADNAVSNSKLGSLVVSADKIQNAAVTADKLASMGATSGQVIKWNGTTWVASNDASGLDLPYSSSASAANYGSLLKITSTGGYCSNTIEGYNGATEGCGIYGENNSGSTGGGYGVKGKTNTRGGAGVQGIYLSEVADRHGWGVYGSSISYTGGGGVLGLDYSESGETCGVKGESCSGSGYGVYGKSPRYGVYGTSSGAQGRAVTGEATGTMSIGVRGIALAANSTGVWGEGANYDFYANGPGVNYGGSSSIRWKKNLTPIDHPVEKVKAIRGVYFDWDQEHGGQHDVGMIAEEVGRVLPEIVVYEQNGIDASGMDYSKITPLLLEAIKAQQEEIESQQKEIESLRARLEAIEETIHTQPER